MPTVLLIDEDKDSLVIFSLILRHHGFSVLETDDVERGFEMACEHQPDLIILEPFAAPVRGSRLTELLGAEACTSALRVLLVTAVPMLVERAIQLAGGGERFLVKPCQPRYLLAEVQRRLEPTLSAA